MKPEEVKAHLTKRAVRKHKEIGDTDSVSDSVLSTSPTGVAAVGCVTTLPNGPMAGLVENCTNKHT